MTAAQAIEQEQRAAAAGLFVVSLNALERQRQRSVRRKDIRQALRTATRAGRQWRIAGGSTAAVTSRVTISP